MPKRILIIDDDNDFCTMLEMLLSRAGYDVAFSPYPITSVEQAFSEDYDLITLDLMMPNCSGAEVAELFREKNLNKPVIVISGYLSPDARAQLKEAGIQHILEKPFSPPRLLETIQQALGD
ncbi:MAG: response regulator [bacterium]|nr:response regulator [bacterium]